MEAVIPAEAHTDDRAFSVQFDALRYFEAADDETLAALEVADFAHSYEADQVARDLASKHAELAALFVYLKQVNKNAWETMGFEVVIDADAARAWLSENRPQVVDTAPKTQLYTVRLELEVEAPTPELAAQGVREDFPEFAQFQFDVRDAEDQLVLLVDAEVAVSKATRKEPRKSVTPEYQRTTFTDRERDLIDAEMARLAAEEEEQGEV